MNDSGSASDPQAARPAGLLQVDIVSDVVCPWCVIGFRQLAKAAAATKTPLSVAWHPFELNPQMPAEGQNLREHIAEKYGTTPQDGAKARARLVALGDELGFTFDYSDDMRMRNTFRAHQLIHWAGEFGKQHALKTALFEAYFTRRENVDDPDTLADAAASVELDRDEALAVLADGRFADQVRQEEGFWTSQGIHGVPAMIFERKHLVTGAQGEETYARILDHLSRARAA